MHPDLTVAEALAFAARFRLPSHTPPAQHEAAVERTLRALGLEGVADSLIGDPDARGISGGQKKRVSIGLELVADPALLLLDEPTSGLDASASRALVAALRGIVRCGVTAAAVKRLVAPGSGGAACAGIVPSAVATAAPTATAHIRVPDRRVIDAPSVSHHRCYTSWPEP